MDIDPSKAQEQDNGRRSWVINNYATRENKQKGQTKKSPNKLCQNAKLWYFRDNLEKKRFTKSKWYKIMFISSIYRILQNRFNVLDKMWKFHYTKQFVTWSIKVSRRSQRFYLFSVEKEKSISVSVLSCTFFNKNSIWLLKIPLIRAKIYKFIIKKVNMTRIKFMLLF